MPNLWQWLNKNAGALGLLLVVLPLAWSVWQYFWIKRQEQRSSRFETYHSLIKQLVEREDAGTPKKLDRQLAVVFELRRFPEYYEPSVRILSGLREEWATNYGPEAKQNRLLEEMDATIAYVQGESTKWLHRVAQKVRGM